MTVMELSPRAVSTVTSYCFKKLWDFEKARSEFLPEARARYNTFCLRGEVQGSSI